MKTHYLIRTEGGKSGVKVNCWEIELADCPGILREDWIIDFENQTYFKETLMLHSVRINDGIVKTPGDYYIFFPPSAFIFCQLSNESDYDFNYFLTSIGLSC